MKKVISVLSIVSISVVFGQNQIQYNILKNDPVEPRNSLNLEFMNMDVNTAFVDNTSFNIGVNGYSKINEKICVSYQVNKSYLILGRLLNKEFPGTLDINAGAQFFLADRLVNRNVPVVLDSKEKDVGNLTYTTTKSVTVPASIRKKMGIQGGVNFKRNAFEFEDTEGLFAHSAVGIYAGLVSRKISNIIISEEQYGNSFRSFGSDIFLDVLILPVNKFKNVDGTASPAQKALPFGFRCGYKLFQVEKKEFTGKKFGISGTASFGYRPFQGWNLSAGIGISILKH